MAATDRCSPLVALMRAAVALPVAMIPVRSAAVETGVVGFSLLDYRESGRMKVVEPVLWGTVPIADVWEIKASVLVDVVSGASPAVVQNAGGTPVQTLSGASIVDHRRAGDARLSRRFGDITLAVSTVLSKEEDFRSRAYGVEARLDLAQRNTTLIAGYATSHDRIGSSDDPLLDERRDTREYLAGITQVLSALAVVQSNLQWSHGKGWYNDPYKSTVTFFPESPFPESAPDTRPDHRNSLAWLTRYRRHFPAAAGTLQADYRYYRDDWGIRSHTVEAAWNQDVAPGWSVRPALRLYTQSAADFYSPVLSNPPQATISSDQRLAAFGGLSPSLRISWRSVDGVLADLTAGYYRNAASYRAGGTGSPEFETLSAAFVLVSIAREF